VPRDFDQRYEDSRGYDYGYDRPPRAFHGPTRGPVRSGGAGGGVPDGLLMGALALLLGVTVLTWTTTGLSGLFAHGTWPDGVAFTRTPIAIRDLAIDPKDIAGAWPGVKSSQLSGYGLFWGLFIGQLLVTAVLAVFAVGTITRARAVRAARKSHPTPGASAMNADARAQPPAESQPPEKASAAPPDPALAVPVPREPTPASSADLLPDSTPTSTIAAAADPVTRVRDAGGPVLVTTTDPALWAATKDARAKLGPVHLFDPSQLCDTPDRLRWSPHQGCADKSTAAARATALLAPLRSPRPIDAEVHATAETLLRCWLHAAALDDRPFREVHRWTLAKSAPSDPVQTLRTHPKASSGAAGELEAALIGHPERRRDATDLIRRALSPLSQLHIRNACTATRTDRIALESFIDETGTLYVVGGDPELMPILNALTQSVVEHGRRMAVRSSPGRLDPPLTAVLELPLTNGGLPIPDDGPQHTR
jgi:hypothetical protein